MMICIPWALVTRQKLCVLHFHGANCTHLHRSFTFTTLAFFYTIKQPKTMNEIDACPCLCQSFPKPYHWGKKKNTYEKPEVKKKSLVSSRLYRVEIRHGGKKTEESDPWFIQQKKSV